MTAIVSSTTDKILCILWNNITNMSQQAMHVTAAVAIIHNLHCVTGVQMHSSLWAMHVMPQMMTHTDSLSWSNDEQSNKVMNDAMSAPDECVLVATPLAWLQTQTVHCCDDDDATQLIVLKNDLCKSNIDKLTSNSKQTWCDQWASVLKLTMLLLPDLFSVAKKSAPTCCGSSHMAMPLWVDSNTTLNPHSCMSCTSFAPITATSLSSYCIVHIIVVKKVSCFAKPLKCIKPVIDITVNPSNKLPSDSLCCDESLVFIFVRVHIARKQVHLRLPPRMFLLGTPVFCSEFIKTIFFSKKSRHLDWNSAHCFSWFGLCFCSSDKRIIIQQQIGRGFSPMKIPFGKFLIFCDELQQFATKKAQNFIGLGLNTTAIILRARELVSLFEMHDDQHSHNKICFLHCVQLLRDEQPDFEGAEPPLTC